MKREIKTITSHIRKWLDLAKAEYFVHESSWREAIGKEKPDASFSMASFNQDSHWCGTPHCIGGWIALRLFKNSRITEEYSQSCWRIINSHDGPFNDLFFPREVKGSWEDIDLEDAIIAAESFLETGKANWKPAVDKYEKAQKAKELGPI